MDNKLANVFAARLLSREVAFNVDVIDVIPKIFSFDLLKTVFELNFDVRLECREGDFDYLLKELALNHMGLVISDRPLPPRLDIKLTTIIQLNLDLLFSPKKLVERCRKNFPSSLNGAGFSMPDDRSAQKNTILSWFEPEGKYSHTSA